MNEFRIGRGDDFHQLVTGRALVLGGVTIPSEMGIKAHSDGDVLVHAICDSLLGALSLGDIGQHFPDSDSDYKGISSLILLDRCYQLIKEHQYRLVNMDSTIILQAPKIGSFFDQMRDNIARVLEAKVDQISIKATTPEHLGDIGRGLGIEARAIVLLQR